MQDVEARIQKLNEKISNIEITDRKGLMFRLESVEQHLQSITVLFEKTKTEHKDVDAELKASLSIVLKETETTKEGFFISNGIDTLDIHDTLKNLQRKTEALSTTRKERETKIYAAIEQRVAQIKEDFSKFEEMRARTFSELLELTEEETHKLAEDITAIKEQLLEQTSALIEKLEQAKNEMMDELENEKKVREKNEGAIYDMLKEVIERLKTDIEKEETEREKTEETILMLHDNIVEKLKTLAG